MEKLAEITLRLKGNDAFIENFYGFGDKGRSLPELLRLLDQIPGRSALKIVALDPLVDKHLPALILKAKKAGFRQVSLVSCPGKLTEDQKALELLLHSGLDSFTAVVAQTHKSFGRLGSGKLECDLETFIPLAEILKVAEIPFNLQVLMNMPLLTDIERFFQKLNGLALERIIWRYPNVFELSKALEGLAPGLEESEEFINEVLSNSNFKHSFEHLPEKLRIKLADLDQVLEPSAEDLGSAIKLVGLSEGRLPVCLDPPLCDRCWLVSQCRSARDSIKDRKLPEQLEEVNLVLQSDCPNNCLFCTFKNMDPPGMTYEHTPYPEIMCQLEQGRRLKAHRLVLVGTEPLEYRELPQILKAASKMGYERIAMQTHGEYFTHKAYLDKLINSGMSEVRMGIYAADAATHDLVAGRFGSFSRVVKAIENLSASSIDLKLHTTLCRDNFSQIAAMEELAAGLSAKFSEYKLVAPFTRDIERYRKIVPRISTLLDSAASQWLECKTAKPEIAKRIQRRISSIAMPPCLVLEANLRNSSEFSPPTEQGKYSDLQATIGVLDKDGKLKESFLRDTRHDIKIAVSCPFEDECSQSYRCPGIYLMYIRAYGLDEFVPQKLVET